MAGSLKNLGLSPNSRVILIKSATILQPSASSLAYSLQLKPDDWNEFFIALTSTASTRQFSSLNSSSSSSSSFSAPSFSRRTSDDSSSTVSSSSASSANNINKSSQFYSNNGGTIQRFVRFGETPFPPFYDRNVLKNTKTKPSDIKDKPTSSSSSSLFLYEYEDNDDDILEMTIEKKPKVIKKGSSSYEINTNGNSSNNNPLKDGEVSQALDVCNCISVCLFSFVSFLYFF
jgi:hypothetical protein